jgi:hypothetical protein
VTGKASLWVRIATDERKIVNKIDLAPASAT